MSIRTENTIVLYEAERPELKNGTRYAAEINPGTGLVTVRIESVATQVSVLLPAMSLDSLVEFLSAVAGDPVAIALAEAQIAILDTPVLQEPPADPVVEMPAPEPDPEPSETIEETDE